MKYILLFLMLFSAAFMEASDDLKNQIGRPNIETVEKLILKHSIVGFSWVDQPINKILLIRNGKSFCAIKYVSFRRGNDQKKETAFNSGEESFYAEADFYADSAKKIKRLKLKKRPTSGFAKLIVFSQNNNYIFCGDKNVVWEYPTATSIISDDEDISLAITRLDNFDEIDFKDPTLEWFKFEEGRKIQIKNTNR